MKNEYRIFKKCETITKHTHNKYTKRRSEVREQQKYLQ